MVAFLQIVLLLHQAMLSIDAIGRSVLRVFVTKKRLLEWETAAEAENAQRRTATVDQYLAWSPARRDYRGVWCGEHGRCASGRRAGARLWFFAGFLSAWLSRAPRATTAGHRTRDEFLRTQAYVAVLPRVSNAGNNWLIPDHVREDGVVADRLSPTNLGLLLNARVAAVHFGFIR